MTAIAVTMKADLEWNNSLVGSVFEADIENGNAYLLCAKCEFASLR